MHITASVYINDVEGGLLHDYDVWLEKLAPHESTFDWIRRARYPQSVELQAILSPSLAGVRTQFLAFDCLFLDASSQNGDETI